MHINRIVYWTEENHLINTVHKKMTIVARSLRFLSSRRLNECRSTKFKFEMILFVQCIAARGCCRCRRLVHYRSFPFNVSAHFTVLSNSRSQWVLFGFYVVIYSCCFLHSSGTGRLGSIGRSAVFLWIEYRWRACSTGLHAQNTFDCFMHTIFAADRFKNFQYLHIYLLFFWLRTELIFVAQNFLSLCHQSINLFRSLSLYEARFCSFSSFKWSIQWIIRYRQRNNFDTGHEFTKKKTFFTNVFWCYVLIIRKRTI